MQIQQSNDLLKFSVSLCFNKTSHDARQCRDSATGADVAWGGLWR
jgi:hypothetical protein